MIIRVAFNNRNWNGKCLNADKRDRRLYKCWEKVVKTGYKIDNKGKCKADCSESSLCKKFKWYNYRGDFNSKKAKGKVYFVYPDIDNSLVLWGKSKVLKIDGDTITFNKFKPMPETKWLRNLRAKDILGKHWGRNPFRYIGEDIEQLLDKLIANSDDTFDDIAEIDILCEEGKEKLKKHLVKERSANLIILFKKLLITYECNICKFDFEKKYGSSAEFVGRFQDMEA